jgi:isoaspartyl peptidase/L-asparaginase-like protein (Ntn-hydrolase superfamily)
MNIHAIAIHGGAGTILRNLMTAEKEAQYKTGLQNALLAGNKILRRRFKFGCGRSSSNEYGKLSII